MSTTNPSFEYFLRVADDWDRLRSGYFTEAVRNIAIAKAYLHPDMTVADVGAGTGFISAGLAPLVRKVHVLDGSPAMLDKARQNLSGFDNLVFHTADGLSLPVSDASVDSVFANMYLHHCADPLASIHEMARILRPGGRLIITDMDAHSHEWLKSEMSDLWLGFERRQMREWFDAAGLVNVIVDSTGESCQSKCKNEAGEHADINIFVAVGTKRISAREIVQETYGARAQGSGCECGDWNCCSPGIISLDNLEVVKWDGGYSPAELADIPLEATQFSLGCGNPIAMAGLRAGEVVLDIGSGGGIDVFLAAKRVEHGGFVIGVDMTPAMLERARHTAEQNGYTNVEFREGYAENLPVDDCAVDVIISNCVINLTDDKSKVFREAYRVLKPGGRLEVNDTVFGNGILPVMRTSNSGWAECISGALPEGEYLDLVRQAGFLDVTVQRSTSAGIFAEIPFYSVQISAKK